jgi:hypothetical protein
LCFRSKTGQCVGGCKEAALDTTHIQLDIIFSSHGTSAQVLPVPILRPADSRPGPAAAKQTTGTAECTHDEPTRSAVGSMPDWVIRPSPAHSIGLRVRPTQTQFSPRDYGFTRCLISYAIRLHLAGVRPCIHVRRMNLLRHRFAKPIELALRTGRSYPSRAIILNQ